MADLTEEQKQLVEWLRTDRGQYGECKGLELDALHAAGLVVWYDSQSSLRSEAWVSWPPRSDKAWVGLKEGP